MKWAKSKITKFIIPIKEEQTWADDYKQESYGHGIQQKYQEIHATAKNSKQRLELHKKNELHLNITL